MRLLKLAAAAAAAVGLLFVATTPAQGMDNGTNLRTGDSYCTDLVRSDTSVRFNGYVTNGSGTASIRASATAGGAETVVWTQSGNNLAFNKYVSGPAGTHFRGCVTITSHTINTWSKSFLIGLSSTAVSDIGPDTATLSPGARACGDSGAGTVRLTGTASAGVTWQLTGLDEDYASLGTIFSTTGATVDTTFTPGPGVAVVDMCVLNSSTRTVTVSYELTMT